MASIEKFDSLKKTTEYQFDTPDANLLETFKNPGVEEVELHQIEFTSVCPITGQPDFGTITISYIPKELCLESKSLKLYLMSYRNYGAFCETLAKMICDHIFFTLRPEFLEVKVIFARRGGIGMTARACKGAS